MPWPQDTACGLNLVCSSPRGSLMELVVNVNERMLKKYTNHGFLEQDFMQEWCLHAMWFFPTFFNKNRFFSKRKWKFLTNS